MASFEKGNREGQFELVGSIRRQEKEWTRSTDNEPSKDRQLQFLWNGRAALFAVDGLLIAWHQCDVDLRKICYRSPLRLTSHSLRSIARVISVHHAGPSVKDRPGTLRTINEAAGPRTNASHAQYRSDEAQPAITLALRQGR